MDQWVKGSWVGGQWETGSMGHIPILGQYGSVGQWAMGQLVSESLSHWVNFGLMGQRVTGQSVS